MSCFSRIRGARVFRRIRCAVSAPDKPDFASPGAHAGYYFPRCEAEERPAAGSSLAAGEFVGSEDMRGRETVLLVEEDTSARRLMADSLGLLGYTVLEAGDLSEAESICRQHAGPIDLLLAEAPAPGAAEEELIESIRRLRPSLRVLFMSGRSANAMPGRDDLPDGGVEYMREPFTPQHLARTLGEVLRASRRRLRPLILVVDDEASVRSVLTRILVEGGYDVVEAGDGDEAIEAVRRYAPGVVIMDLVMPQKEGLETIAEVRRLAPEAKIIAISGAFGGRFLTVATHLGASATLSKPIAADVLLRTVNKVL